MRWGIKTKKSNISNSKLLPNEWNNLLRIELCMKVSMQCCLSWIDEAVWRVWPKSDLLIYSRKLKTIFQLMKISTLRSMCHWLLRGWFANKGIKEPSHFHNLDQNNAFFFPNWNVFESGWQGLIKFHLVVRNSNSRCQWLVHNDVECFRIPKVSNVVEYVLGYQKSLFGVKKSFYNPHPDLRFVKKLTRSDFRAKKFTYQKKQHRYINISLL